MDKQQYEVVFCIVNSGFSDSVMNTARLAGVQGGTVMRAQGTASKEAESIFNITIQPDKEIVMMLVPKDIKDDVLHALYKEVGLETPGNGIAFSMPVGGVAGIGRKRKVGVKKKGEKPEEDPDHLKSEEKASEEKTEA